MKTIFLYGEEEKLTNYTQALKAAGARWVCSLDLEDSRPCDGLLLPGGGDIAPARYGQEDRGSGPPDLVRDQAELDLIARFLQAGKPMLGICRGMQALNVALGGTLIQDLPTAPDHKASEETGDSVHPVTAAPGSFLHKLYGARFSVNSAHHQAADCLGEGLLPAAQAPDGVLEAMECLERKILATQFHPERMTGARRRTDTVDGGAVFRFFLSL